MNIIVEIVLHTFQLLKVFFKVYYCEIEVWDDLDNLESDKSVTVTESGVEYNNIFLFGQIDSNIFLDLFKSIH